MKRSLFLCIAFAVLILSACTSRIDDRATLSGQSATSPADPAAADTPKTKDENTGGYAEYSAERLSALRGKVVLFFSADDCASCAELEDDLEQNLQQIPTGLTILKVDINAETKLKTEYSVSAAHTLVLLDAGSPRIQWRGSRTLQDIREQVERVAATL